jgi:hypothetical protein
MTPLETALRAEEIKNADLEQRLKALEDFVYERGLNVREFDKVSLTIQLKVNLPKSKALMLRHLVTDAYLSSLSIIEIVDQYGSHNLRGSGPRSAAHIALLRSQVAPHGITIHNARASGFYLDAETKERVRRMCGIEIEAPELRAAA